MNHSSLYPYTDSEFEIEWTPENSTVMCVNGMDKFRNPGLHVVLLGRLICMTPSSDLQDGCERQQKVLFTLTYGHT